MSVSIDAGSFHRGSPHRQPNHLHHMNGGGPSPTLSHAPPPSTAALLQAQHQANQYHLYHSTGAASLASSSSSASASLQQHLGLSGQAPTTFDAVADFHNSALDDDADDGGGKMVGEYSGLPRPDSKDGSVDGGQATDLAQSYYDPFRVKHRRRTSPPQLKVLEYHFEQNPKPDVALRKALSEQLDMTPREVQVWFQNRRAKTKKLREKQEKDASEAAPVAGDAHTTFSVPPRRNSTAEISHMASQSQASVIRPPPSNPADFNNLRRGSSPAVLTAGLTGTQPSYEQYYEALSRQQFPLQPPNPNARPQHYSSPPLHPHQPPPPFYASPLALSTPALSSTSHSSHSPSDLSDYPPSHSQPIPGTTAPLDDPSQGGRRFSLPAFTSPTFGTPYAQLAWSQQKDGTTPTQQSFAPPSHPPSSVSSSYTPDPAGSFPPVPYGAPPPAEHHGVAGEMLNGYGGGLGRPGTRSGEGSSGSPDDYSPGSSLDEQHLASQEFVGGGYPPHLYSGMNGPNGMSYESQSNLNQYTFGSMSHGSSYEDSITPLSTDSFNFGSNNSSATSPGGSVEVAGVTSPSGGRRSSCPAGFLPNFDNLGIASPTHPPPMWPPASYQDSSALSASLATSPPLQPMPSTAGYPSSSMEAYLASVPGQQPLSSSLPSSAPPFPFATQQQFLQNSQRRGSTSSALGTIAEQPGTVGGFNPDEMMDQNGSPGADRTARKVRSQASLRAPYPTQDRRSPNSLHERRGSAPGYDLGFLPPSTSPDY